MGILSRYITLYAAILSLSVRRTFAFRANLIAETLVSVINVIASLVVVRSVFWISESLAGWSDGEVIVLLGFYLMGSGLLVACVEPNLSGFRDTILRGQLDDVLLRPASSMMVASLGACSPLVLSQTVAGIGVLLFGVFRLPHTPSAIDIILALALFTVGCVAIWAVRLMVASLAFWAPSAQPDVGFRALWEFGRYPISMYARPIQLSLTILVPVALVANVPAQAMVGTAGIEYIVSTAALSGVSIWAASAMWHAGLRRYTSATS